MTKKSQLMIKKLVQIYTNAGQKSEITKKKNKT